MKFNKSSKVTKKGCIHFQGSLAQKLLRDHLEAQNDLFIGKKALWESQQIYQQFELKQFCDLIDQEQRTKQYFTACKENGKFKYS